MHGAQAPHAGQRGRCDPRGRGATSEGKQQCMFVRRAHLQQGWGCDSPCSLAASGVHRVQVHPYLTALSIAMGMYAFELQGVVLGPLLLCVTLIFIDVTRKLSAMQAASPLLPRLAPQIVACWQDGDEASTPMCGDGATPASSFASARFAPPSARYDDRSVSLCRLTLGAGTRPLHVSSGATTIERGSALSLQSIPLTRRVGLRPSANVSWAAAVPKVQAA